MMIFIVYHSLTIFLLCLSLKWWKTFFLQRLKWYFHFIRFGILYSSVFSLSCLHFPSFLSFPSYTHKILPSHFPFLTCSPSLFHLLFLSPSYLLSPSLVLPSHFFSHPSLLLILPLTPLRSPPFLLIPSHPSFPHLTMFRHVQGLLRKEEEVLLLQSTQARGLPWRCTYAYAHLSTLTCIHLHIHLHTHKWLNSHLILILFHSCLITLCYNITYLTSHCHAICSQNCTHNIFITLDNIHFYFCLWFANNLSLRNFNLL